LTAGRGVHSPAEKCLTTNQLEILSAEGDRRVRQDKMDNGNQNARAQFTNIFSYFFFGHRLTVLVLQNSTVDGTRNRRLCSQSNSCNSSMEWLRDLTDGRGLILQREKCPTTNQLDSYKKIGNRDFVKKASELSGDNLDLINGKQTW
jgi:hypothetical protein